MRELQEHEAGHPQPPPQQQLPAVAAVSTLSPDTTPSPDGALSPSMAAAVADSRLSCALPELNQAPTQAELPAGGQQGLSIGWGDIEGSLSDLPAPPHRPSERRTVDSAADSVSSNDLQQVLLSLLLSQGSARGADREASTAAAAAAAALIVEGWPQLLAGSRRSTVAGVASSGGGGADSRRWTGTSGGDGSSSGGGASTAITLASLPGAPPPDGNGFSRRRTTAASGMTLASDSVAAWSDVEDVEGSLGGGGALMVLDASMVDGSGADGEPSWNGGDWRRASSGGGGSTGQLASDASAGLLVSNASIGGSSVGLSVFDASMGGSGSCSEGGGGGDSRRTSSGSGITAVPPPAWSRGGTSSAGSGYGSGPDRQYGSGQYEAGQYGPELLLLRDPLDPASQRRLTAASAASGKSSVASVPKSNSGGGIAAEYNDEVLLTQGRGGDGEQRGWDTSRRATGGSLGAVSGITEDSAPGSPRDPAYHAEYHNLEESFGGGQRSSGGGRGSGQRSSGGGGGSSGGAVSGGAASRRTTAGSFSATSVALQEDNSAAVTAGGAVPLPAGATPPRIKSATWGGVLPSAQSGLGARRVSFASDRTAGPAAGLAVELSGGGGSGDLSAADLEPVELQESPVAGKGSRRGSAEAGPLASEGGARPRPLSPGQSFGGYQVQSMLSQIQGQQVRARHILVGEQDNLLAIGHAPSPTLIPGSDGRRGGHYWPLTHLPFPASQASAAAQPAPPRASPLPPSLLEALRNSGEWTSRGFGDAPDGGGGAPAGMTARDAMLSASHWVQVAAQEETPQQQQAATEAPPDQAGLRDPSAAGIVSQTTIPSPSRPSALTPSSSTSRAVAAAVAAVSAAVAALNPITNPSPSPSSGGVGPAAGPAAPLLTPPSRPSGTDAGRPTPVQVKVKAVTVGGGTQPSPSLLPKFISVGGGGATEPSAAPFVFSTPSLPPAPIGSARAATPSAGLSGARGGDGAMYSQMSGGSGGYGYVMTPPGSVLTATPADLDRLKDEILEGLRQALHEALHEAVRRPDRGDEGRRQAGGDAAAGGAGVVPERAASMHLSRADLESFLFDKQVRLSMGWSEGAGQATAWIVWLPCAIAIGSRPAACPSAYFIQRWIPHISRLSSAVLCRSYPRTARRT